MNVSGHLCCLVGEIRFDGGRLARHPVGCFAVHNRFRQFCNSHIRVLDPLGSTRFASWLDFAPPWSCELPAPASRIQILGVNCLFLLIDQEASTDKIAALRIMMQD